MNYDEAAELERQSNEELSAAKALQTAYYIIEKLETSKRSSEDILEDLPEIFVICSKNGKIIKGNQEAASTLGVNIEDLLKYNILSCLEKSQAEIFGDYLKRVGDSFDSKTFEMPLSTKDGSKRNYLWSIGEFTQVSRRRGKFIRIIGRDITELKNLENRLSSIFASTPLGILTCNKEGKVIQPYSAYTEVLLQETNIEGRDVADVLFSKVKDKFDSIERSGVVQLVESLNQDPGWFMLSKTCFPKRISIDYVENNTQKARHLGLDYHPILENNLVSQIMIIIHDRTDIVQEEKASALERRVDSGRIKKIVEIQKCDSRILEVVFEELDELMPRIQDEVEKKDYKKLGNIVHTFKGVVRTAELSELVTLAHEIEDEILSSKEIDEDALQAKFKALLEQWREAKRICYTLSGKSEDFRLDKEGLGRITKQLQLLHENIDDDNKGLVSDILNELGIDTLKKRTSLNMIAERLHNQVSTLRKSIGKNFEIDIDFSDKTVPLVDRSKYAEIFLHLLNNAVDHGIENPDLRKKANKPEIGKISVTTAQDKDYTIFFVKDDGSGVDPTKIKSKAIKLGIVTKDEASNLSESEILNFLLLSQFSTKSEITDISGRGIGLDIVNDAAKAIGSPGGIKIESVLGEGTTFSFKLKL